MANNKEFQMFKTIDEDKFNQHIEYLVKNGIGFCSYTNGDYYIVEYTGAY